MAAVLLEFNAETVRSPVLASGVALRSIIAGAASFQALIDGKSGSEALTHTTLGRVQDEWLGKATRDDLDNILCRAYIVPPRDVPSRSFLSDAVGGCPHSSYTHLIRLRRQVREADIGANDSGIAGVTNYFWDCIEQLRYEIVTGAQSSGGAAADLLSCELDPTWGEAAPDAEASQGPNLFAEFRCEFGFPEEG